MRNWGKVDLMLFASHRTRPQVRAPAIMRPLLPVLQPGRASQGSVTGKVGYLRHGRHAGGHRHRHRRAVPLKQARRAGFEFGGHPFCAGD